jgi:hypothetical protein
MRVAVRAGRGTWMSGGGGLFLLVMMSFAAWAMTLVVLAAAFFAALLICTLAQEWFRSSRSFRLRLLAQALDGCVEQDTEEDLIDAPPVWAVYVMGSAVHYGRYPFKGESLARLFPDRVASIAKVAVFPDSRRASRAATLLRKHRFSFEELLRLFPANYRAPGKALPPALQA